MTATTWTASGDAPDAGAGSRLDARHLTLAYDRRVISEDLTVAIPDHSFTVIVGPNACGKSTLLRPTTGEMLLDGKAIASY